MSYIGTNVVAIVAATLVGLAIGVLHQALCDGARTRIAWLWIVAFLAEFWLAAILAGALILAPVQANPWIIALGTPVVIWIGFVLPVIVVSYGARRMRISAMVFDAAHWLAVMVGQAAVLHMVGLTRP